VIVVLPPTVKTSPALGAVMVRVPLMLKAAEIPSLVGWPASASTTLTLTFVLKASGTVQARPPVFAIGVAVIRVEVAKSSVE
jgi:hypothetical protein